MAIASLAFTMAGAQNKLTADTGETQILWYGEKVTGDHHGTIDLKSGWLTWQDNKITGGEFIVDMASLEDSEDNQKLENHLKSGDFFDVSNYPAAKLVVNESTEFEKGSAAVKGQLTIKEDTHPVEFKVARQDKEDGMWFYTTITLDRTKYNVRYGSGTFFDNLGDRTIYDEFRLRVSLLVK